MFNRVVLIWRLKSLAIKDYALIESIEVDIWRDDDNAENKNLWGNCTYNEKKIRLKKDMSLDLKKYTLTHELVHAIKFYMGYGALTEENVCDFVAAHFDEINRILKKYFKEENLIWVIIE